MTLSMYEILIPSMLLQPFLENIIEHGFRNKSDEGKIEIELKTENDLLHIIIEDNGMGLDHNANPRHQDKHRSRALEITQERLLLLAQKYQNRATVSINNRTTEQGVRVEIKLPIIY
jgi:sensor histidine kinase YesM